MHLSEFTARRVLPCVSIVLVTALAFTVGKLQERGVPSADAQASASGQEGRYLMATSGPTNAGRTEVFIFDTDAQAISSYESTPREGLRLLGVRKLTYDLLLTEFKSKGKTLSVADIKDKVTQ